MNRLCKLIFFALFTPWILNAQQIEVMTLGTFHFSFRNKDVIKIDDPDQIDVYDAKYQLEINDIVSRLVQFRPTHIAVEIDPKFQSRTDSIYTAFLNGKHSLSRDETEQLGFRIAKSVGIQKLYCTNDWGTLPRHIEELMSGPNSTEKEHFMNFFYNNPDTLKFYNREHIFKTDGILAELRNANKKENIKNNLGNYLISVFKYETETDPYFGVDFTTGWWFNRNLRIFRNIQNIPAAPGDRILVIYGSGHMNLLNPLFDASPEYNLIEVNDYLK